MRKAISGIHGNVQPAVYVVLAFSLLYLPIGWVIAWIIALLFHELCHYAALRLCRCSLDEIEFGMNGAVMSAAPMDWKQQLFCTLAGPTGSLCLIIFGKWFPEIAVCALLQSMYNLLPIMPMDGGRIIECIFLQIFSVNTAKRILKLTELSIFIALGAASLYAVVYMKLGIIPVVAFLLLCLKNRKTPCKADVLRVQ